MFSLSRLLWRSSVSRQTVLLTTSTLNSMLDLKQHETPVPREDLKKFLMSSVVPVLQGTSFSAATDHNEARRQLSQLLRDACFAAVVVRARPNSRFVSILVDCIEHDKERLRFIANMTPTQASRIVEHMSHLGVRSRDVYAALCTRVDFSSLRDVARVMFALTEADMEEELVLYVLPMYCGESWELESDGAVLHNGYPSKSNVYEAVRIYRALSKAVRKVVEVGRLQSVNEQRSGGTSVSTHGGANFSPLQLTLRTMNALRANILSFIFKHRDVLRGAHWINIARASLYFPQEYTQIQGLEQGQEIIDCSSGKSAFISNRKDSSSSSTLESTTPSPKSSRVDLVVTTDDVVAAAVRSFFATRDGAEGSVERMFDCNTMDLVKVLPLLEHAKLAPAERIMRTEQVLRCISKDLRNVDFGGLLQLLRAMRRSGHAGSHEGILDAFMEEASRRLRSDTTHRFPLPQLTALATLISTFRVKSCKGFAESVAASVQSGGFVGPTKRHTPVLTIESVGNILAGLASTSSIDGATKSGDTALAVLDLFVSTDSKRSTRDPQYESSPLIMSHSVDVTKVLRFTAALNVVPSQEFLWCIFGPAGSDSIKQLSRSARSHGAVMVFDLARSLYNYHTTLCAASPSNDTSDISALEATVWTRGVVSTLVPLCAEFTRELASDVVPPSAIATSHVPLSWRSTIEAVYAYVDPNLDRLSLVEMKQRLEEVMPMCMAILQLATAIAGKQIADVESGATPYPSIPFSGNAVMHLLSLALHIEYMLYNGSWQAELHRGRDDDADRIDDVEQFFTHCCSSFESTIQSSAPSLGTKDTEIRNSPSSLMDVLRKVLAPEETRRSIPTCRLTRDQILEVTSHLPFAFALAVRPGPLNTFFTETAAQRMISIPPMDALPH